MLQIKSGFRVYSASLLGIAAISVSTLCEAYSYRTCNGTPVKWDSPTNMYRDRCSMPDNSERDWSYYWAGWNWWNTVNVINWNWWYNANCTISHGNGRNETAVVARSAISGNNGLTVRRYDSCIFSWDTQIIEEADVMLANDMVYSPEDESFWNWSNAEQGRVVNIHELGHALGLNHSENFNTMRALTPLPIAGGNTSEPYPDDANGARFLYPGYYSINLFASAQKLSGGSIVATEDTQNTRYACRGGKIWVTVTVGNNGTTNVTGSGFRVYLNDGPNKYSGGWNMWTGTASVNAGSYFTQSLYTTVPNVAPGLYWVLWQIDTGNTTPEYNESDNAVHSVMRVQVLNC